MLHSNQIQYFNTRLACCAEQARQASLFSPVIAYGFIGKQEAFFRRPTSRRLRRIRPTGFAVVRIVRHRRLSAGGIATALPLLGSDPFLVINGDILTDIDFSVAVRQSETLLSDGLAYLWLTANPPHNPAGDFSLLSDGLIRSEGGGERLTFSGCGLYKSELFAETAPHRAAKLAPLLREAMTAGKVRGHCHNGLWLDVGTPERLNEARCLAASW